MSFFSLIEHLGCFLLARLMHNVAGEYCSVSQFLGLKYDTVQFVHVQSMSLLVSFLCCPYFCIILNYHYPSLSKAALVVFKDKASTLAKSSLVIWIARPTNSTNLQMRLNSRKLRFISTSVCHRMIVQVCILYNSNTSIENN